ncbi:hypothetical protein ABZT26_02880 [Streptomyces sp. NPDC005395]|uniref:hypothetical protein n=1 Tax=Streptomyces sp. NPDC005395 TaxID=3157042 RepID=UPI0033B3D8EC
MTTLPAYITTELRFPAGEILCKGDRLQRGCEAADGQAAFAVHTFQGKHFCAYHSPFDHMYAPCVTCGEKPALYEPDADPVCDDCCAQPAEPAAHVCDEDEERAAYRQYVSDGLADTDGHYAPEPFEAWRAHYHRAIGHTEPRTADCTPAECNAPSHERLHYWNDGTRRKPKHASVCASCNERRLVAYRAARAA